MFTFLLVLQAIVAASLVGVILIQRSEGGGLGMGGGGSPGGLMSARGAANFLTRATTGLAIAFVALSIILAALAAARGGGGEIDTSLARTPAQAAPQPGAPTVPLAAGAQATGNEAAPADDVPLAQ
jgi:preprotein translocase subunit SecG